MDATRCEQFGQRDCQRRLARAASREIADANHWPRKLSRRAIFEAQFAPSQSRAIERHKRSKPGTFHAG